MISDLPNVTYQVGVTQSWRIDRMPVCKALQARMKSGFYSMSFEKPLQSFMPDVCVLKDHSLLCGKFIVWESKKDK